MPKRTDIHSILILGAGPIVIGQACEFDYSGVQACKALKAEGYRVILINSNPATIMTDPEFADATYIEPLTVEMVEKVIAVERPDALLPTVGGQTGLNLAVDLAERGVLDRYGLQLIGASLETIQLAEDRQLFNEAIERIGLKMPESAIARSAEEALALAAEVGYPLLVRPSFTLGGTGGGIAHNKAELIEAVEYGCRNSPVNEVLVDRSVLGWKEYELEVMRDRADNFVVICSIENLDPMGVHTGDSITVAPAQTLTDKEYQRLRDAARAVLNVVGVETGGSNVQFAVNPTNGELLVIEMNPRVSRSSALASKATGFPIAKIAALLAVGYTLDEIPNDITRETPVSFEPSLDYVVVKLPRWAFEKFPGVDPVLGPQMKSVGEVMAIGRAFKEALNKGIRSLEIGNPRQRAPEVGDRTPKAENLKTPTRERLFEVLAGLHNGVCQAEIIEATGYDPWFVDQLAQIVEMEQEISNYWLDTLPARLLRQAKRFGLSDEMIGQLLAAETNHPKTVSQAAVRQKRLELGITPVYHRVDTCAAEFEAHTPYLYSTYESQCEANPTNRKKVMILGGGPNRIGQGIEFDCCCVQACFALREAGYETIMVNCNPETVSTDYDTADRLYFEPLTLEDSFEVDVDAVADCGLPGGERVVIGGIMQHIEEAGVHSGDSACVLPPYKISAYHQSIMRDYTAKLGRALQVRGLMNVQYAIKDDVVYVLEVNPRASRTVPFVSKVTNVPLAKIAARVMAGETLQKIGFTEEPQIRNFFVKEAVLPFRKFAGVDAVLGPEMRSTGEVMGHAQRFGAAFAKAQMAVGDSLPRPEDGAVVISVNDFDKGAALKIGRDLSRLGFRLMATHGTAAMLRQVRVKVQAVNKVSEGEPHLVDMMRAGEVSLIINTPLGSTSFSDGQLIRQEAARLGIPLITTLTAAQAAVNGIELLAAQSLQVRSLQEIQRINFFKQEKRPN